MCIFYDTATISNFCIFILFSSIHTTLLAGVVHRQKNTDELVIICSRLQKKIPYGSTTCYVNDK